MEGMGGAAIGSGLLAAFLAVSLARTRAPAIDRHWTGIVAALAVVGLLGYLAAARVNTAVSRVHIHHWDVYHYYVGPKYFEELGQAGLYEATVIADFEDDRGGFQPNARVRDLHDSRRETTRAEIVARRAEIVQRFSASRWVEFKRDIAYFRAADPAIWRASTVQRDHGYNGTPLLTAVWGGVANHHPGSTADFLKVAVWLDLVVLLGVAAWIGLRIGPLAGCVFALFWFANPLNDYEFTGGALFRHAFLFAIAGGVATLRGGSRAASGVWFAIASGLRLFPVVFPLALLAHDLLRAERRQNLRENRRFYASFVGALMLLVAASSLVSTPDGENAWLAQISQVGSRESVPSPNGISLRFPFLYSAEHNVEAVLASVGTAEPIDWLAATERTFAARLPAYVVALIGLAGCAVAFVRRVDASEALFAGIVALYGAWIVSHYYYALLAVVPLMLREDRRALEWMAAGGLAIGLSSLVAPVAAAVDLRFAVCSAVLGAVFVAILGTRWRAALKRG